MRARPLTAALILAFVSISGLVRAEEEADAAVLAARKEFVDGAALVRAQRWGEALAAFERAAQLKPHAITTYNVAQCERAMGQYTRARRSFVAALAEDEAAGGGQLPDGVKVETRGLVVELDRILARANVTLKPEGAAIAVDGRPLEREGDASFVAGTLDPGPGASPRLATFTVVMNPGVHVVTVSRQGYQDVVVNRSFAPGAIVPLDLELDRLPAAIHVTSNVNDAIVRVNGADVGNPPVEVSRAAGQYRVSVTRKDFVPYEANVTMRPGERVDLAADLRREDPPVTKKWWFWTAAGVLVAGAAATTYFVVRANEEPTRQPTDGGGLGWSLRVP